MVARVEETAIISPTMPIVSAVAQAISTPLDLSAWCYFLHGHPDRDLFHFFLQGISEGFRIGFNYHHTTLKAARKNLACAISHFSVVDDYLHFLRSSWPTCIT